MFTYDSILAQKCKPCDKRQSANSEISFISPLPISFKSFIFYILRYTTHMLQDDLELREKTSNLSKIAEAAGRKMKKLKTNWSMKKNDITRSLSKIKRPSRTSQGEGAEGRRKVVRRLSSTGIQTDSMAVVFTFFALKI